MQTSSCSMQIRWRTLQIAARSTKSICAGRKSIGPRSRRNGMRAGKTKLVIVAAALYGQSAKSKQNRGLGEETQAAAPRSGAWKLARGTRFLHTPGRKTSKGAAP